MSEEMTLVKCGDANPQGNIELKYKGGCGEKLAIGAAYRCTGCGGWFHKHCIFEHFKLEKDHDWGRQQERENLKYEVHEHRNELKRCPVCNAGIEDRQVALYKGIIRTLYSVYVWCKSQNRHEFSTKDIRGMMSHNDYARFGDLVRFGGIVYKPTDPEGKSHKAQYGINMERAAAFFQGTYRIPVQITIDQITNMIIDETTVDIKDFPELHQLLTAAGLYDPKKEIDGQKTLI